MTKSNEKQNVQLNVQQYFLITSDYTIRASLGELQEITALTAVTKKSPTFSEVTFEVVGSDGVKRLESRNLPSLGDVLLDLKIVTVNVSDTVGPMTLASGAVVAKLPPVLCHEAGTISSICRIPVTFTDEEVYWSQLNRSYQRSLRMKAMVDGMELAAVTENVLTRFKALTGKDALSIFNLGSRNTTISRVPTGFDPAA